MRRGQVIAIFLSATTFASIIAGPLCGATLKYMDGLNGWHGWQWLFLVQGLPAVLLGVLVFLLLEDKPADAKWLSTAEKDLVRHSLTHDVKDIESEAEGATHGKMLRDPKIWLLALAYFLMLGATYTIVFWAPTLVQSWGIKDLVMIGMLTAIPSAVGIVGMILMGRSSDKHHERRWHFAVAVAIAAVGLFAASLFPGNVTASVVALSFATIGIASATPLFFTLVSEYLAAGVAAVGIAMISSLGNLGPAVSPYLNGLILKATGSNAYALYMIVAMYVLAGILLLVTVRPAKQTPLRAT